MLSAFLSTVTFAAENALIDTTRSPYAQFYLPDLGDVTWNGGVLGERFEICRTSMVPYMWEILSDPEKSHAWDNYLMAAGLGEGLGDGKPHGPPFTARVAAVMTLQAV